MWVRGTFTRRLPVRVTFKQSSHEFRPWRPEDGRVMTRTFAFDTETTRIDEARPWVTPAYVLGAAFDGRTSVFVPRDRVGAFLRPTTGSPSSCTTPPST